MKPFEKLVEPFSYGGFFHPANSPIFFFLSFIAHYEFVLNHPPREKFLDKIHHAKKHVTVMRGKG